MIEAWLERCTPEKRAQCAKDNPGEWLSQACKGCDKRKPVPGGEYIARLFELHNLREGGYPFDKNELTLEAWHDLGVLKAHLESKRPRLI